MAKNTSIDELICRVFTTRGAAHLAHWKTRSIAEHEALGDFYDGIIDSIDTLVEAYQGNFGLVNVELKQCKVENSILAQLKSDASWIASNRSSIANKVDALENLIDGLTEIYLKAIYKLTFLS